MMRSTLLHHLLRRVRRGKSRFQRKSGAKHSPSSSAQRGPKGKIQGSTQIWFVGTSNNQFSASWALYQKVVDNYDRISLKFIYIQPNDMRIRWKLLPGPKRVKNDVQNVNFMEKNWKSQDWSRMILYESREVQEAFLATRASLKRSQYEDMTTSKKHPLGAIGTHKIIPKSTNLLC